jgi:hypothetical protein
MTPTDRLLTWLMRLNAAVLLCAVVPVFFSTDLMAVLHERLGLGTFPRDRLTDYLTRSAAACYALHGGVVLLLAGDVRKYRELIGRVYLLHLAFALTVLGIDLVAGMPPWWTLAEGGTIACVAVAVLLINRRAKSGDFILAK